MAKHKRRAKRRAPTYDHTRHIYESVNVVKDIAIAGALLKGISGVARSI